MPAKWPNPWCLASPEKQAIVLKLWGEGKRVRECAKATNLPDGSVWNILEKAGHKPGERAKALNKRSLALKLLAKGKSIKEVATELNTSPDYVRQCRRDLLATNKQQSITA